MRSVVSLDETKRIVAAGGWVEFNRVNGTVIDYIFEAFLLLNFLSNAPIFRPTKIYYTFADALA